MRSKLAVIVVALSSFAIACSSSHDETRPSVGPKREPQDPALANACKGVGTSTLPGVCIGFTSDEPTWTLAEAAAGVSVAYVVIVEAPVADVITQAQDAGNCEGPGPSGLSVFERLGDGEHQYCQCDSGLCPSPEPTPATIPAGRSAASFMWTGHEWNGASDTNNPLGPAFGPGTYTLDVSARGTVDGRAFEVRNQLAVHLVL